MKKQKEIDPSKVDGQLRMKAVNAFKAKYGILPADAGYPVVRQCQKNVYFARSQDDWREYVKATKRVGNQATAVCIGIILVMLIELLDWVLVQDHQLTVWAMGSLGILWTICTISQYPQQQTHRQILVYDDNDGEIYLIAI